MKALIFCAMGLIAILTTETLFAQDFASFGRPMDSTTNLSLEHQQAGTIEEQKVGGQVPLIIHEQHRWAALVRANRMEIDTPLEFRGQPQPLPSELKAVEVGGIWNYVKNDKELYAASISVGSEGAELFENGKTPNITGNAMYRTQEDSGNSWMFFASFSNSRSSLNNIPIPGFAYGWNRPTYSVVLGLPFAFLNWRPEKWSLLFVASPFIVTQETSYRFWGPLQGFGGWNWNPRSFQNVAEGDDRLLLDRKEVSLGLKGGFSRTNVISLAYVYAYDRSFFIAKSVFKSAEERVLISDSGGVQLKWRYSF